MLKEHISYTTGTGHIGTYTTGTGHIGKVEDVRSVGVFGTAWSK